MQSSEHETRRWLRVRSRSGIAGFAALATLLLVGSILVAQRTLRHGSRPASDPAPAGAAAETDTGASGMQPGAAADERSAGADAAAAAPELEGLESFEPLTPAPEPDPLPPEQRVPRPASVRGIYLNAWAAGSSRKRTQLIDLAARTEVNAFVIDVKDASGYVSYRSSVPLVSEIGADRELRIGNIRSVLAELREHGIYPIARIVVFKDPILANRRPDLAIQLADGSIWRDHNGEIWVDPYNREVWDYNVALAREAVALGFSEVQWDYVRFPDVPRSYMATAVYPARADRARETAIREFMRHSREQLADLRAPVTSDVFGLTVSAGDDMGIGQRWDAMVDATDVLLPMVYPSHFARGSYGIAHPNARPYEVVKRAMEYAIRRTEGVADAATIRPWLQDFTLGWPPYGPAEVRAQIQAVYDAGLEEWILWNPGGRYTAAALAAADGTPPDLPLPDHGEPPGRRDRTAPPADSAAGAPAVLGRPVAPDTAIRPPPDTAKRPPPDTAIRPPPDTVPHRR